MFHYGRKSEVENMAYVPLWKKILGREYGICSTMEENLRQKIYGIIMDMISESESRKYGICSTMEENLR